MESGGYSSVGHRPKPASAKRNARVTRKDGVHAMAPKTACLGPADHTGRANSDKSDSFSVKTGVKYRSRNQNQVHAASSLSTAQSKTSSLSAGHRLSLGGGTSVTRDLSKRTQPVSCATKSPCITAYLPVCSPHVTDRPPDCCPHVTGHPPDCSTHITDHQPDCSPHITDRPTDCSPHVTGPPPDYPPRKACIVTKGARCVEHRQRAKKASLSTISANRRRFSGSSPAPSFSFLSSSSTHNTSSSTPVVGVVRSNNFSTVTISSQNRSTMSVRTVAQRKESTANSNQPNAGKATEHGLTQPDWKSVSKNCVHIKGMQAESSNQARPAMRKHVRTQSHQKLLTDKGLSSHKLNKGPRVAAPIPTVIPNQISDPVSLSSICHSPIFTGIKERKAVQKNATEDTALADTEQNAKTTDVQIEELSESTPDFQHKVDSTESHEEQSIQNSKQTQHTSVACSSIPRDTKRKEQNIIGRDSYKKSTEEPDYMISTFTAKQFTNGSNSKAQPDELATARDGVQRSSALRCLPCNDNPSSSDRQSPSPTNNPSSMNPTTAKQMTGGAHEHVSNTSSIETQPVQEMSPRSLKHLRDVWPTPSGDIYPGGARGCNNFDNVALGIVKIEDRERRQKSSSSMGNTEKEEEEDGEEEKGKDEKEEGAVQTTEETARIGFFRDRRLSTVYFTDSQADDFPWLTWSSSIHPDQADLDPSPEHRLQAACDPNFILNLVLRLGEVVGQGQYGTVYTTSLRSPRCQDQPSRQGENGRRKRMALKKLPKAGQENTVHALAEKRALTLARDCPFVITMFSCFQTKLAYYLLMEMAEGGCLTQVLNSVGRFPEPNVRFYAAQLLSALSFLHDCDILHRDLKMDNVLLGGDGYVRLCDFGLSMDGFGDGDQVCSPCGTLFYVAPEVLRGEPYSKTADWWSFGVLLFYMATGYLPFDGKNIQMLYVAVTRKDAVYPSFLSADVISFTRKMLTRDAANRPGNSAEQRQSLKDDEFFTGVDWDALHDRALVPPELPKHRLLPYFNKSPEAAGRLADPVLSASFPFDFRQMTPAQRDWQSKQTRSRSLDPTGLFAMLNTKENAVS